MMTALATHLTGLPVIPAALMAVIDGAAHDREGRVEFDVGISALNQPLDVTRVEMVSESACERNVLGTRARCVP
jgi:hypothetical protein